MPEVYQDPNKYKKDKPDAGLYEALIVLNQCKVCVEIGVAHGATTKHLCKGASTVGGQVYGFDVWATHGEFNRPPKGNLKEVTDCLKRDGHTNFRLTQIDTKKERQAFEAYIKDISPINFCFIDGCHSYHGVKNDFDVIYPYMDTGGIIALDDTLHIDGCREFALELRKTNDGTYDIVEFPWGGPDKKRHGITLLVKRSFSNIGIPISQKCGSKSQPDEILYAEKQWYEQQTL